MKESMLKVFGSSLVRLGLNSPEMNKEYVRFRKRPELYSCFCKDLKFNFGDYTFKMRVEAPNVEKINPQEIQYSIADRKSKKVLLSTFCCA